MSGCESVGGLRTSRRAGSLMTAVDLSDRRPYSKRVTAQTSWYSLDDTIIFNALKKEHLVAIVELQLLDLKKNLASKNVTYSITKAARERIIDEGYDKAYGARPMRRVIQSRIENEIAEKFLRREFREGGHIQISARGKNLVFTQKFKKSDLPLPEETE